MVRLSSFCSACGASDKIEFHHIEKKKFTLGDHATVMNIPIWVLITEMEKCIPLCPRCHFRLHKGVLTVDIKRARLQHSHTVEGVKVFFGFTTKPKSTSARKQRRRTKRGG